jgi:hypothetical protein
MWPMWTETTRAAAIVAILTSSALAEHPLSVSDAAKCGRGVSP